MYDDRVLKICGKRVIFEVIGDVRNATRARTELKGAKTGVCRVTEDFALGYDLKMGSPLFVIVAVRDWERVTSSTLDQMMGRSSRD